MVTVHPLKFANTLRYVVNSCEIATSLLSISTHMKTLRTNWNIIIVDNWSNVWCDKITTTINHTRYKVLLYVYLKSQNHMITTMCTTYYIPLSKSLRYSSGISNYLVRWYRYMTTSCKWSTSSLCWNNYSCWGVCSGLESLFSESSISIKCCLFLCISPIGVDTI